MIRGREARRAAARCASLVIFVERGPGIAVGFALPDVGG